MILGFCTFSLQERMTIICANMGDILDENILVTSGRKSAKKLPDFDKYSLPECIKVEAKSVYQRFGISTHEGIRQRQLMYASFYIAGIICGMPQLPDKLRYVLNLDARQASGANTYIFQAKSLGICDKTIILTPIMFVNSYLQEFYPEKYKMLMETAKNIWSRLEKNDNLRDKQIQILAAYIVYSLKVVKIEDVCRYFFVREKDIKIV